MERLDQVICGSLQAMSLQIPITEVKIPIWFTKGKGRRKGQGTCRDPSCMSSASAERGSLTFPESLLPSYRAEMPPPGKAGREGLRKAMDPVRREPATKPVRVSLLSHTQCPAMVFVLPPHTPLPHLPTPILLAHCAANMSASERQRRAPRLAWE